MEELFVFGGGGLILLIIFIIGIVQIRKIRKERKQLEIHYNNIQRLKKKGLY